MHAVQGQAARIATVMNPANASARRLKNPVTASPGNQVPARSRSSGFTLVELLVVIAIIAVLAAIALCSAGQGQAGNAGCFVHEQPEAAHPGLPHVRGRQWREAGGFPGMRARMGACPRAPRRDQRRCALHDAFVSLRQDSRSLPVCRRQIDHHCGGSGLSLYCWCGRPDESCGACP